MRFMLPFLRSCKRSAAVFLLFTAVFAVVLFLYNAPYEAVLYAALLCAGIGSVLLLYRFLQFRKRMLLYRDVYENLPLMTEELPVPDTPQEQELQRIIAKLQTLNTETVTRLHNAKQDSIDYFTVWAHQIKTPISAMQMLLQSEDTDTNRELLAELFKVEQYAEMALHYLRLDGSTNDLLLREYALDGIIRQAVHRYAPLFVRRRLKLVYESTEATVLTDEKWLLFIIEQLLSNAIKYTSKGTVTIAFADGVLTVSDTGMGIPAEDLPRIFEKGYTGLSGHQDRKSTGLGLYLCRKAANQLGHRLSVQSTPGIGSCFSVDLRRERTDPE